HNILHEAIEIAIGSVILCFVPALAEVIGPMLTGILGGLATVTPTLATVISGAILGAASSVAEQAAAVELGDQRSINWQQVLDTAAVVAATNGVSSVLGIPNLQRYPQSLTPANLVQEMVVSEVITAVRQITELLTGQESKPDWHDFAISSLSTLTTSLVNSLSLSTDTVISAAKELANDE